MLGVPGKTGALFYFMKAYLLYISSPKNQTILKITKSVPH